MRTINIREISQEILKEESIEDYEDFENLCAEALATNALEFLEIDFDPNKHTISIAKDIDLAEALAVVNNYFDVVNEEKGAIHTERSKAYDDHTRDSRGADDGTFDYAGTYVISILCVIIAYFKNNRE